MSICFYYTNIAVLIVGRMLTSFFHLRKLGLAVPFLVCALCGSAQFSALSGPEKRWAVLHPFAAMKVRRIQHECDKIYDKKEVREKLDTFSAGGKLDAYRHTFYMAAFSQRVRTPKVRKLGIAHEKGNYDQFLRHQLEENELPDSLSSVMDLLNNELGIAIGCNNRDLALTELSALCITEINSGRAYVFKRDPRGQYTDCSGSPIDLAAHRKRWYIPKCLVRSNSS